VRFLTDAQALDFDVVIQQHGDGRVTNVLACLLGGRRTAGFHGAQALVPDPATFLPYPVELHEVRRHLRLMEHLGAPPRGEQLELLVLPDDRAAAAPLTDGAGAYAVLHPGAADPARRWPAAAFAQLGRALARRGLGVLVTGSPAERDLAGTVAGDVGPGARSLAGRTDLGALAAVIDGARLVVSNDTGPAHVAVARGVPSVVAVPGAPDRAWLPLDGVRHPAVVGAGGRLAVDAVLAAADALLCAA
jgi:ADP-heptose:LPS heptosyltransferase